MFFKAGNNPIRKRSLCNRDEERSPESLEELYGCGADWDVGEGEDGLDD